MGYNMDKITKQQRRKIMQSIKSKDTKSEITMRKELWKLGHRNYRKNYDKIIGKPDIVFPKLKIAIFIDSEFFHGYNWEEKKNRIGTNRDYWIPKIERNMQRDENVNKELSSKGWTVLRFWDKDVKKNLQDCINKVEDAINKTLLKK